MSDLEKRVEALENIIKPDGIILTDQNNPAIKVKLRLSEGQFLAETEVTTVEKTTNPIFKIKDL